METQQRDYVILSCQMEEKDFISCFESDELRLRDIILAIMKILNEKQEQKTTLKYKSWGVTRGKWH